jgi:hypothetical protein
MNSKTAMKEIVPAAHAWAFLNPLHKVADGSFSNYRCGYRLWLRSSGAFAPELL